MLELFSSGLMSVWLDMAGIQRSELNSTQEMVWPGNAGFVLAAAPEPQTASIVEQYLQELGKKNPIAEQAIWMQSGPVVLANNQGTTPLPAASLTKIATSLAALSTWDHSHQFETLISATGPINNGVLQGDLIVIGNGDPLFVWEDGIALANSLNRLGIKKVTGKLVIRGRFSMNENLNPMTSGQLLMKSFNSRTWTRPIIFRYSLMPKGTPKPQLQILGGVKLENPQTGPQQTKPNLLLRHRSLTLTQLLKEMNIFSSNNMSEIIAESLGGAQVVRRLAANAAGVPLGEIQLINGSGLGVENRISARAVCAMLMALQRKLQPLGLTIGDFFPVSGRDRNGTMSRRHLPQATVIKTGTLRNVSALAGVMPTRDRGLVWFAIINRGNDVMGLRAKQDSLLQNLIQQWGISLTPPSVVLPTPASINYMKQIGASDRNQIILKSRR
ncbi:D-alanyl-D-alanine carboxypeptidase [[Phormidium ambiguum] IAM M-71]|uniref:D-alanyl-D-alanine carboxypeptidase n=1 Tax=[Phormidium ambiguum] IAM M-71 TaxID=454136 RepID=A0A1U7IE41_9CYAN|nr:D-alanyl-D-alanine carboxypeptidase [Phormidium ambiguum]OKH35223.1 D-alanyl-D-alanine carboxypeptidase [Phormidium ambiguum IAM M-71]